MTIKLLTEHHLEFPRLKGDCIGLSEFTLVKLPHCWKLHVAAQLLSTVKPELKFTPCALEVHNNSKE